MSNSFSARGRPGRISRQDQGSSGRARWPPFLEITDGFPEAIASRWQIPRPSIQVVGQCTKTSVMARISGTSPRAPANTTWSESPSRKTLLCRQDVIGPFGGLSSPTMKNAASGNSWITLAAASINSACPLPAANRATLVTTFLFSGSPSLDRSAGFGRRPAILRHVDTLIHHYAPLCGRICKLIFFSRF